MQYMPLVDAGQDVGRQARHLQNFVVVLHLVEVVVHQFVVVFVSLCHFASFVVVLYVLLLLFVSLSLFH